MSTGADTKLMSNLWLKQSDCICWWLFSFQILEEDKWMGMSTSNWRWRGNLCQLDPVDKDIKRIEENGTITAFEIGQGEGGAEL